MAVFTAVFSLVSLFVKEKLYIGEATVASIYGLIVGPDCLNWFAPTTWGNSDYITLELSRIALVVQIFAVAVELPKKYMLRHWVSVFMLLVPVMTAGFLIVGAFVYLLFPGFNFSESLIISACITATDPVLAAAVVGKGKFAQRVPGHLRNILSAESGCNDGMAFPFIYLGINLVLHHGHPGEIIKDWICLSILYECGFGCLVGIVIGYVGRHAIKFAEKKNLIDRESLLAFYFFLALMSAGFGSMLGVDDLLVSFAAGVAFSWDGWFSRKTEEAHVSTVIDLLLNMAYFVYFGAIIPWSQFNNHAIGTDVWRLVVLALVVLFLRRIPAVLALKPLIPDIKTWREALFCGHFGPIGVSAVFAAILARSELEKALSEEKTPLKTLPLPDSENYQLIACIWPIVTFLVISSIIVHGSSVAVLTLGRHLNGMALSMSFSATNTGTTANGGNWLNRLPKLEANGRTFSLHRIDTMAPKKKKKDQHDMPMEKVETSGIKYRPAGGMDRKKRKSRRRNRLNNIEKKSRPQPEQFDLTKLHEHRQEAQQESSSEEKADTSSSTPKSEAEVSHEPHQQMNAFEEGDKIIVEDHTGEVVDTMDLSSGKDPNKVSRVPSAISNALSPIASLKSSSSDKKKVFAYKVGNYLVIENEQGEIIRRYEIHSHGEAGNGRQNKVALTRTKPRSDSLVGKTLSAVGLGKLTSETAENPDDLKESGEIHDISEDEEDDDDEDLGSTDESEVDEETEVEKKRRLAALSKSPLPRDDSDEEDTPAVQ